MKMAKDNPFFCELCAYLGEQFMLTRSSLQLTQWEFAYELNLDRRSYVDIEHRKNLCCAVTLLTYLCYYCEDVPALLDGCRSIIDRHFYSHRN